MTLTVEEEEGLSVRDGTAQEPPGSRLLEEPPVSLHQQDQQGGTPAGKGGSRLLSSAHGHYLTWYWRDKH